MFCERLNEYIDMMDCSGKEFSEYSGISEASVSRYRSGARTPKANSEDMKKLCRGIASAAGAKGLDFIEYADILREMNALADGEEFDFECLRERFDALCNVFSINIARMSKTIQFDSSYISRIRNGKRKPSKPREFAFNVAVYFSKYYDSDSDKKSMAELLGINPSHLETRDNYAAELTSWLSGGKTEAKLEENTTKKFLTALDSFDLNEYIKAIRFDELKVPTLPFQLPTTKIYYGVEEMKNAELDFFKATTLSKSKKSVFMYNDMRIDDMANDADWSKKYMFSLALMLKKGLRLDVIHNISRPFNELMYGLECWIPLYMTGQISPYYLKGTHNRVFGHSLNVSGAAALSGECVSGFHSKGRYYLTKSKDELAYFRERSACILKKAYPLMEIYREDKAAELSAFMISDSHTDGNRRSILSTLPIYTATNEFLEKFLDGRNVSADKKRKILDHAAARREQILEILKNNPVSDEIPQASDEMFKDNPPALSLSLMFCDENFEYTYDEYDEHLRLTMEFAKENKNYTVVQTKKSLLANIQITMHENEFVMISKNKAPTIHFVLRHPILREAIENLEFLIL